MRLLYTKPTLVNLSQGARISFARQFRMMSQDELSNRLGLTGECKRRTMTRYEKGDRNPKDKRLLEISSILNVSSNSIKVYDYKNPTDIIYVLMWLEELIPNYIIDISKVINVDEYYSKTIITVIKDWNVMRTKRLRKEITYEEYIEWKLNYELVVNINE